MGDERAKAPPPKPGDPHWMPVFDDLMAAAVLIYEASRHAEALAEMYEEGAGSPALPHWRQWADEEKEHARQLNRAAAILDWVARRADRLELLSQPTRRSEEVSRTTQFQPRRGRP
jgi:hypothetical protein